MAITRPTRPELIASGILVTVTPRRRYADGKYTEEVTGYELLLSQPTGAQLAVRVAYVDGNLPIRIPDLLQPVNVVCNVNESREYGASLSVVRDVTPDDLDKIASGLPVLAKG
jgi:hypothetical protein